MRMCLILIHMAFLTLRQRPPHELYGPVHEIFVFIQGSHRLEKYLNLEGFFGKSLKVKSALKSNGKSLESLEKPLNSTIFCRTFDRDLNQNKSVVPLFGAAYAAPNIGTTIVY